MHELHLCCACSIAAINHGGHDSRPCSCSPCSCSPLDPWHLLPARCTQMQCCTALFAAAAGAAAAALNRLPTCHSLRSYAVHNAHDIATHAAMPCNSCCCCCCSKCAGHMPQLVLMHAAHVTLPKPMPCHSCCCLKQSSYRPQLVAMYAVHRTCSAAKHTMPCPLTSCCCCTSFSMGRPPAAACARMLYTRHAMLHSMCNCCSCCL